MTNTPDKSEMKSCPFCGKPPVVQERKGIMSASVGCDCAASPCVLSLDIALAKAIWNARAFSSPPADQVPDMVERVARALCVESGDDPDDLDNSRICKTDGTPLPLWAAYEGAAIAALQAVPASGEPTGAMVKAGYDAAKKDGLTGPRKDCEQLVRLILTAALKASGEE